MPHPHPVGKLVRCRYCFMTLNHRQVTVLFLAPTAVTPTPAVALTCVLSGPCQPGRPRTAHYVTFVSAIEAIPNILRRMSHSQKWPLLHSAHKSRGEWSVCHAVRQLHNSNGTVHRHEPRHNPCPCPGSDKPPAAGRPFIHATTHQQTTTPPAAASQHNDIFSSTPTAEIDQLSAGEFTHPTLSRLDNVVVLLTDFFFFLFRCCC